MGSTQSVVQPFGCQPRVKIPKRFIHSYQGNVFLFDASNITFVEQGDELPVKFSCKDGSQNSGKWILEFSEFFSIKVAASEKMGNDSIFDYTNYKKQTIRLYLDALHGLPIESIELVDGLELMRFLCYEGKTSKFYSCLKLIDCQQKVFQKHQSLRRNFTMTY